MIYKEINTGDIIRRQVTNEDKCLISHNHDSSNLCPSNSDCVDRCPLGRYCVDMCPLSNYYVGMCLLSTGTVWTYVCTVTTLRTDFACF